MHSYVISAKRSWNSAIMFQRKCCASNTTSMAQTLTTRSCQQIPESGITHTTPRQGEMLVGTHHGAQSYQHSHNSIRKPISTPDSKPTSSPDTIQLCNQRCLILKVDGGSILDCRSRIGRGDGSIILTIDSKPNLVSLFSFCRPAERQKT